MNTPYAHRQSIGDLGSSRRRENGKLMVRMPFDVCKVCGNAMSHEDIQSISYCRQVFGKFIDFSLRTILLALIWTMVPILAAPSGRSFEPEPLRRSVRASQNAVDDWFESISDVFGPRQVMHEHQMI